MRILPVEYDILMEDIDDAETRGDAGEESFLMGSLLDDFTDFLSTAIRREFLDCITFILDEVPDLFFDDHEEFSASMMHTAITHNATKSMALLLKYKCILKGINQCGGNDNPPLGHALLHNNYSIVESLLRHGASHGIWIGWRPNPCHPLTVYRGNILSLAVRSGDLKMVELLLDNGLSPDGLRENEVHDIPLVHALKRKHVEIAKLLIFRGAVISSFGHPTADLPLNAAIRKCSTDTVLMLLDARANFNVTDMMGIDALFISIMYSKAEVISILLDRGVSILRAHSEAMARNAELSLLPAGSEDKGTENPQVSLYMACMLGQEMVIEMFTKESFDINFSLTERFKTPLGAAVHYKRVGAVKMLLDAGADTSLVNSDKLKALTKDRDC